DGVQAEQAAIGTAEGPDGNRVRAVSGANTAGLHAQQPGRFGQAGMPGRLGDNCGVAAVGNVTNLHWKLAVRALKLRHCLILHWLAWTPGRSQPGSPAGAECFKRAQRPGTLLVPSAAQTGSTHTSRPLLSGMPLPWVSRPISRLEMSP